MGLSIGKEEAEALLGLVGQYSAADLRKAYKRSAKRFHPDIAVTRGMSRSAAEEKMKLVNQANDHISSLFNSWPYPEFLQSDFFGEEPSFNFDRIYDDEVFEGAYVTFGRYPGSKDGLEQPLSWYVIEASYDSALLISEQCIDALQFNETFEDVVWGESSIRRWLNQVFFSQAFSPFERKNILRVNVNNDAVSPYGVYGGSNTADSVFFLSAEEASDLFVNNEDRICVPTEYSHHRGVWTSDDDSSRWWLRSPGRSSNLVAFVDENGVVHDFDGLRPTANDVGIRPAIRIKLERRARNAWDLEERRWQRQTAAEHEKALKREAEERLKEEAELAKRAKKNAAEQEEERARKESGTVYGSDIVEGERICFGTLSNELGMHSSIYWRVLHIGDGRALLLADQCIATMSYHPHNVPCSWSTCSLREWLNDGFLYEAFSPEERVVMRPMAIEGTPETDYVRLLTCSELLEYLPEKISRVTTVLPASPDSNSECGDTDGCDWWLMDSGIDASFAAYVYRNGQLLDFGLAVGNCACVRPVIAINVI